MERTAVESEKSDGSLPPAGFGGDHSGGAADGSPPSGPRPERRDRRSQGGFFAQYKPDQGRMTRRGTFIGAGLLVAWGSYRLYDFLRVYEGDSWQLLITPGLPILLGVVFGVVVWRLSFVSRKSSDFMIATEGEMKKVSWSGKSEVIGSTKVVIAFTVMLALLLFFVDFSFQQIFRWIGVLKVGG